MRMMCEMHLLEQWNDEQLKRWSKIERKENDKKFKIRYEILDLYLKNCENYEKSIYKRNPNSNNPSNM